MTLAPERVDMVLSMVASGTALSKACATCAVSRDVFYQTLYKDAELSRRYAEAVGQQTRSRFAINCTGD